MKYASLFLLALTLLLAGTAQAGDIASMKDKIKQPMTIEAGKSKRMNVVFNHTSHRGINCFTCHHAKTADNMRYVACQTCHQGVGRMKDPSSKFMAFHGKKSKHSCYACHLQKAKEKPARYGKIFVNCRPCHYAPAQSAAK
ncbi:MAG: cytochrome c3 family protein [Desulfovibrionaceae bacterium]|nr:cytochrome c3 family protein [Desulfovibrionaceae bacterium]